MVLAIIILSAVVLVMFSMICVKNARIQQLKEEWDNCYSRLNKSNQDYSELLIKHSSQLIELSEARQNKLAYKITAGDLLGDKKTLLKEKQELERRVKH